MKQEVGIGNTGTELVSKLKNNFDELYDFENIDSLAVATSLDGTEDVPAVQSGNGVSIPTDLIGANPLAALCGLANNRFQVASHFVLSEQNFSAAASGDLFGAEPFHCYFNGTGAGVSQDSTIFTGFGNAKAQAGTSTTGYAAVRLAYVTIIMGASDFDIRAILAASVVPGTPDVAYRFGLMDTLVAAPTHGVYFEADNSDSNWIAVCNDNGIETRENTGVAVNISKKCFHIAHEDGGNTVFYIDGVTAATISTNRPSGAQALQCGFNAIKSAGASEASFSGDEFLYRHYAASAGYNQYMRTP